MISTIFLAGCGNNEEKTSVAPTTNVMPVQQTPVPDSTEDSLNSIGRFCYYPYSEESLFAPAGTNEIILYFERTDIIPNTGYVTVYDSFTGMIHDTIDVSDPKRCLLGEFDSTASQFSGWDEGSCIHLYFDKSFEADSTYHITMDSGCFMTLDELVFSRELTVDDSLCFGTTSYGLNAADTSIMDTFVIGDTWNIGVFLDNTAVSAVVTGYDGRKVALDKSVLEKSGIFTLEFLSAGDSALEITFYDATGKKLNTISFSFTILV